MAGTLLAPAASATTQAAQPSVNGNGHLAKNKAKAAGGRDAPQKKPRRKKKKNNSAPSATAADNDDDDRMDEDEVEIEYVQQPTPVILEEDGPAFKEFESVFSRFATKAVVGSGLVGDEVAVAATEAEAPNGALNPALAVENKKVEDGDDDDDDDGKTSKKKKRLAERLTVAQLKQLVSKPDVVEWVDITAADPKLLVHLKSYRNTVPVPMHWQQKRKYLQGKRGIEKPPFVLPDFIKATGIMEMRDAVRDREEKGGIKGKTRDRMQPKMGKLDIDYQKLHDAFFRWQTKPKLSTHGDLYFEGKEFETKLRLKKPGQLSDELRAALGMPPNAPPPWLINMQRYGPPPSYPSLKIAGLNSPIPAGAMWGYHPGGWGKPPVNEYGQPLYGDVFGVATVDIPSQYVAEIERKTWGELEEEAEEPDAGGEEEAEEDQEEEESKRPARREEEDIPASGLVTPSGIVSTVPSGLETPEFIELRKERRDEGPKELYQIIPQKDSSVKGFMGSQHAYDMSGVSATAAAAALLNDQSSSSSSGKKRRIGVPGVIDSRAGVEVALNPEDLEEGLKGDAVRRAYEGKLSAAKEQNKMEDFSDMVAEHANRQSKKRKTDDDKKRGSSGKKEKFKF